MIVPAAIPAAEATDFLKKLRLVVCITEIKFIQPAEKNQCIVQYCNVSKYGWGGIHGRLRYDMKGVYAICMAFSTRSPE
ncbi:MAG TPA: hypothetical protein PK489_10485, partial [Prolixibacteraceae bacterium]|nr:hypothetical protein [Prolixibacteraceae bacterium]